MAVKRLRVFAGPNGSGKTTIINSLKSEIPFGVYVNADDIESLLKETHTLLFNAFQLTIIELELHDFFRKSKFAPEKRNEPELWQSLSVSENILHVNTKVDSYLAADLAEFIRHQLLANQISFTYETVMSHDSKLAFLKLAKENDYRIYLYFIATEDPEINISRVDVRIKQNGHAVAPEIIKNRYYKSLQHLKEAVKLTNRAFVWDNSGKTSLLVAEINDGINVKLINQDKIPNWFLKYLANKED
jgi:predicted ABC-type ATPase